MSHASRYAPAYPQGRPQITTFEINFARERRPRASWDALAKMLGVSAPDLRNACKSAGVE